MKKKSLDRIYKNYMLTSNIIGHRCYCNENTNDLSKVRDIWFENTNPFPKLIFLEIESLHNNEKIFISPENFNFEKLNYTKGEKNSSLSNNCFAFQKSILNKKAINIRTNGIFICGNAMLKVSESGLYLDKIGISVTRSFSFNIPRSFLIWVLKKMKKSFFISWLKIQPIPTTDTSLKEWNNFEKLSSINASDIADLFVKMKEYVQSDIISSISLKKSAEIIEEMDIADITSLLRTLSSDYVAKLLLTVTRKKAGWIVRELGKESIDFLNHMNTKDANEILYLSKKDPITAGGIMEIKFQKYYLGLKARDVLDRIKKSAPSEGSISYIYVVDLENEIKGILSIQSLILADENAPISSIMTGKIITIRETEFKDDIAVKMEKYHLLALPVVDGNNRIQGIVTIHEILKTLMIK
jgi:CBS domain-containing protein